MEKKLTTSDYLILLGFIFMLVCAIGAFFFGFQVGQEKAEQKYISLLDDGKALAEETTSSLAYDEQHLISFYHMIFQPYREFQDQYLDQLSSIETQPYSEQTSDVLYALIQKSDDTYEEIRSKNVSDVSPLLVEAQRDYLRSLKQFSQALDAIEKRHVEDIDLLEQIKSNTEITQAVEYSFSAQEKFYGAIAKWHEQHDYRPQDIELVTTDSMSVEEWSSLAFNYKNLYVSSQLSGQAQYKDFFVQDLTSQIDAFIRNHDMNSTDTYYTISEIIEMIVQTGGVRQDDFLLAKSKYYEQELLPDLPFF